MISEYFQSLGNYGRGTSLFRKKAGCYALIREWLIHNIDKTPREIAELLVDIVSKDYL